MAGHDDEYDLIKQVVGLGVMVNQIDKKLDSLISDNKSMQAEYKALHKDMDGRVTVLEQFHYSYRENKVRETVEDLKRRDNKLINYMQLTTFWIMVLWTLFSDKIKGFL